ncbi:MAG: hypothetical protein LBV60_09020 [Streptomyces sp.]|nr:hypothetical protein [Streptomyces sp.]
MPDSVTRVTAQQQRALATVVKNARETLMRQR